MAEINGDPGTAVAPIGPGGSGPVRWGVIGATSMVARQAVLPAMVASEDARLVAIATRGAAPGFTKAAPAGALVDRMAPVDLTGVRVSAHYEDIVDAPDIDAVYIPLPNGLHGPWTMRAAAAGKHVLCEKPLSVDPAEASVMVEACRSAGVVLAEAYMTPFHPRARRLAALVSSGALGELRFARAAFTFPLARADDHRWDPVMGGGVLADVGIYCLAPVLAAAERFPVTVAGAARLTASGVDASMSAWMDFGDGFCATLECSFEAPERQTLEFVGTAAMVTLEQAFTPGVTETGFEVHDRAGGVTRVETGGYDPYRLMIEDFAAVVRGTATPARTCADAVALLGLADDLRRAAGLRRW